MTRQYDVHRSNELLQNNSDHWILQRAVVRELPVKTLTSQTETVAGDHSGRKLDLLEIPVSKYSANPNQLQALAQSDRAAPSLWHDHEVARVRDRDIPVQRQEKERKAENKTGLPDSLKEGIESLSGYDLSGVRVNYNSPKPAQLNAHAYTQGQAIEVAPGQERHLPHEAWHVVQQMQGRVKPTKQLKGKVNINDDAVLEKEADVMGLKAVNEKVERYTTGNTAGVAQQKSIVHSKGCGCASCTNQLVQRKILAPQASVTQLTCDKGHKNHPKGPCPVKNQEEFDKKRENQKHAHHGGDAKGRTKMDEKRKKKKN